MFYSYPQKGERRYYICETGCYENGPHGDKDLIVKIQQDRKTSEHEETG